MIIAQARSTLRSYKERSTWILVDGETESEILDKLRHRVLVAVGMAAVFMAKQGADRKTIRKHLFHDNGRFPMVVEVKWGEHDEPQRFSFNVSPDEIIGDLMERLVMGQ